MRGPLGSDKALRTYLRVPLHDQGTLEEIRQVHDAWLAAELRGDVESILRLCTADVRWLVPGRSVLTGRQAGRQLLQPPQVELVALQTSDLRVEQSGELACKTSRYETRYRTGEQERAVRGTHLWLLRRQKAGWRVSLVTWQAED